MCEVCDTQHTSLTRTDSHAFEPLFQSSHTTHHLTHHAASPTHRHTHNAPPLSSPHAPHAILRTITSPYCTVTRTKLSPVLTHHAPSYAPRRPPQCTVTRTTHRLLLSHTLTRITPSSHTHQPPTRTSRRPPHHAVPRITPAPSSRRLPHHAIPPFLSACCRSRTPFGTAAEAVYLVQRQFAYSIASAFCRGVAPPRALHLITRACTS